MGYRTTDGTTYRSPYHAAQRLNRELAAALDTLHSHGLKPFVRDGLPLAAAAVREDGTSRITVHTYRHGRLIDMDDSRKGQFNFSVGVRHLCACERDGCIGKNGYADGKASGDFTGSLCGKNHPDTPSMPTIPVKQGEDYHRKVKIVELTGVSMLKKRTLTERVGGGSRGLNIDCPEYRRNMTSCHACGKSNCWGKTKAEQCREPYRFAFFPVAGVGWVEVAVDPSHPQFNATAAALDLIGSVLRDRPSTVGGV
jgi:hypothetical protein